MTSCHDQCIVNIQTELQFSNSSISDSIHQGQHQCCCDILEINHFRVIFLCLATAACSWNDYHHHLDRDLYNRIPQGRKDTFTIGFPPAYHVHFLIAMLSAPYIELFPVLDRQTLCPQLFNDKTLTANDQIFHLFCQSTDTVTPSYNTPDICALAIARPSLTRVLYCQLCKQPLALIGALQTVRFWSSFG